MNYITTIFIQTHEFLCYKSNGKGEGGLSSLIYKYSKQIKCARCDFESFICIWNMLLLTINMKTKELSLPKEYSSIWSLV